MHLGAAVKVRNAGKAARMPAAPAPRKMAARVRREAQARPNVAVLSLRAAPAQPNPRTLRLRVVVRRSPPSGPRRPPARYRPRLRAPRSSLPQSGPSLPLRRPSGRVAQLPRNANGIVIVPPASARGSSHQRPKPLRPRRLRRLSRQHRRPRPSSGLPQARPAQPTRSVRLARPMRRGRLGRVTRSDRTASALVTSVLARTRPPRPPLRRHPHRLPRRLLPLLRQRLLRRPRRQPLRQRGPSRLRQRPLLLPPQHGRSRRLRLLSHRARSHRPRPHLSRPLLPPPSRWMLPASASRTCAGNAGSVVRADESSLRSPATAPSSARAMRSSSVTMRRSASAGPIVTPMCAWSGVAETRRSRSCGAPTAPRS